MKLPILKTRLKMNICDPLEHEFMWHQEIQGVSFWVCRKCGELKEQNEDLGSGG